MAHPFRYFRKHQKAFMAVAVIIAMFVFVIGDYMVASIGQGGGQSPSEVITSWKGGRLTRMEIEVLTQRRYFLSQFLERLRLEGARRLMEEGGTPMMPSVPNFVFGEGMRPQDVQLGVVTTRILSEQAKKAGITISDEVINHFLKETSFRRVTDAEMISLLQGLRGGGDTRGLEEQLFSGLRELLLGNAYIDSYKDNVRNVLPEQRWEDWKRINDRISLEVATLPVTEFVSEVPDPSDADLLAFYEQYKDTIGHVPHPVLGTLLPSPDPGFKQPRRVRLSYLLGDVNAWGEKYRDSITEEEIADYYERNKRTQFVKTGSSPSAFDESLFDTDPATDEETPATDDPAEEPATDTSDETQEPPQVEPTEEIQTEVESDEEIPADETPAEEASENDGEQPAAPAEDESGSTRPAKKFQLTAFQENAETADEEEAANASTESEASDTETANAAESPAESDDEEDETEYEPLDSVRDTIRNRLATDKAVVELKKVMDRIYGSLQTEYNPYGFEVVSARSEKKEIPPPPATLTNLKERAAEVEITSEETVLLTQRELADTFVGKAIDAQTKSKYVTHAAFADLQLYEPMMAQDLDGNWYLVTKVEDVPESVPAFDEIRGEVLQAWKAREAAKLALEKAEELAAEAQKSGDILGTFFIGKQYDVTTTDLFSWLTFGTTPTEMQQGAKLGEAPPLEAVGPDFMTKAFELETGDVAALLNYDQTKAYVFRLDRRESTPEELRNLFLREANSWYGGQVMMMARWRNHERSVLDELIERVGVDVDKLEKFLRLDDEEQ